MTQRTTTSSTTGTPTELHGGLSVIHLFFTVMAWNAPLVIVFAAIPLIVGIGNGVGAPGAFLIAGIIIALFAVTFTRMARLFPNPGAFYAYISAGLGKEVGLGCGLLTLFGYFVGYAGAYAFGGAVTNDLVSKTFDGPDVPWWIYSIVMWAVVSILGYLKFTLSAKVLTIFLLVELLLILIYDTVTFVQVAPQGIDPAPLLPSNWFDGSFGIALLFALGMFGGFELTALFRGEVKDPVRTVPRATFLVIAVGTVLYALTCLAFVNGVGVDRIVALAADDPTGTMWASIATYGGTVLVDAMTAVVVTSTFAVLLTGHNVVARYAFNLSADRILPSALSSVHTRHGSPHRASIAASVAAAVIYVPVILLGVDPLLFYAAMLGMTSLVLIVIMFIANIAIPAYLIRSGKDRAEGRPPAVTLVFPILAGLGLGAGVVLAIGNFPLLTGGSPALSNALMVLLAVLFLTGIVLAAVYRRTRPDVYAKIGRQ